MTKSHKLFLQFSPSETAVYRAAAQIFSGYVAANQVTSTNEQEMMRKAVSQAMVMAQYVEDVVISDDELDPDENKGA